MDKNALVSIIIPIYNVEKFLEKCIDSCLNQTYENTEIILIDDGSTDSSGKICDEYQNNNKNIFSFHKNNGGVSSARNEGIKRSNGEYIIFVDADDYLAKDFIEYMINLMSITKADMCISKNCFMSNEEQQIVEDNIVKLNNINATKLLMSPMVQVGCWNKIYKKDLLNNNNIRFSEDLFFGEGLEFIIKSAQKSNLVGVGERKVYYYRKNNLNSATTDFKYMNFVNGEKALLKIKEEISVNDDSIISAWNLHYILFCINTLINIISNDNEKNNKKNIKSWKRKISKNITKIIMDKEVKSKYKIKAFVSIVCPQILVFRNKNNKEKIINESV